MNTQPSQMGRLQAKLEEQQKLITELYNKLEQRGDKLIALQKELRAVYRQDDSAHGNVCDVLQ